MDKDLKRAALICQSNNLQILQTIIPSRINANTIVPQWKLQLMNRLEVPLLCIAAAAGALDCVKYLIKNGANIDAHDNKGYSSIHWAALGGHEGVLQYLIESGAKINDAIPAPLLLAARQGRLNCSAILIEHQTDLNIVDQAGRTPLHLCAWFGHSEIAKLLVSKGASVDQQDNCGRTPIHVAAWFGNHVTLTLLMEKKPDVNAQDKAGNTPLHLACQNNHKECVEKLLRWGANTKLKNGIGLSVLNIAEAEDKQEILELLQKQEGEETKNSGLTIDKAMIHEQKQMNKSLDEIVVAQTKHTQLIASLSDKLQHHGKQLAEMNIRNTDMKKQLQEMEKLAQMISGHLKDLMPQKSNRFTMTHININR